MTKLEVFYWCIMVYCFLALIVSPFSFWIAEDSGWAGEKQVYLNEYKWHAKNLAVPQVFPHHRHHLSDPLHTSLAPCASAPWTVRHGIIESAARNRSKNSVGNRRRKNRCQKSQS
jgi:hypothetical protein